jgi:hypothetical protein
MRFVFGGVFVDVFNQAIPAIANPVSLKPGSKLVAVNKAIPESLLNVQSFVPRRNRENVPPESGAVLVVVGIAQVLG